MSNEKVRGAVYLEDFGSVVERISRFIYRQIHETRNFSISETLLVKLFSKLDEYHAAQDLKWASEYLH